MVHVVRLGVLASWRLTSTAVVRLELVRMSRLSHFMFSPVAPANKLFECRADVVNVELSLGALPVAEAPDLESTIFGLLEKPSFSKAAVLMRHIPRERLW